MCVCLCKELGEEGRLSHPEIWGAEGGGTRARRSRQRLSGRGRDKRRVVENARASVGVLSAGREEVVCMSRPAGRRSTFLAVAVFFFFL